MFTVAIEGRLDTTTAPQLEKFLSENSEGIKDMVIDMAKLEYISSAGLRVILGAHNEDEQDRVFEAYQCLRRGNGSL